jgi:RNA recognition motif-containing protein
MDELHTYFSKVGIIDIDPESLKPKIKLYRYKNSDGHGDGDGKVGELKGDASICYARPESVELALQILDENLFRDGAILSVQRAKFEQRGDDNTGDNKSSNGGGGGGTQRKQRRVISEAKRRVARLAAIQAVGWDEGENGRIAGGLKGLRIIVLMNMFDPKELVLGNDDDNENDNESTQQLRTLEREIHTKCEEIGAVEKITIFSKHPAGVVIVKFVKPNDASDAVKAFNGKVWEGAIGRKVEASFWDGITDYTAGGVEDAEKEMKENEKRLDKFGDWLEEQELPEEFQLRVEE